MTSRSEHTSGGQGSLFDKPKPEPEPDDPKPNSPEDLGMVPPRQGYGEKTAEPDPIPVNMCSSAIQHTDAKKFVAWILEQDLPTHVDVTFGHIVVSLSGLGKLDLRWLCQAIKQAGRAPSPDLMARAVKTHDVSVLREDDGDDYAIGTPLSR